MVYDSFFAPELELRRRPRARRHRGWGEPGVARNPLVVPRATAGPRKTLGHAGAERAAPEDQCREQHGTPEEVALLAAPALHPPPTIALTSNRSVVCEVRLAFEDTGRSSHRYRLQTLQPPRRMEPVDGATVRRSRPHRR
jgi:hypothetical protein